MTDPTDMERAIWTSNLGRSRLPLVAHVRTARGVTAHEALAIVRTWEASGALPAWPEPVNEEIDITEPRS